MLALKILFNSGKDLQSGCALFTLFKFRYVNLDSASVNK